MVTMLMMHQQQQQQQQASSAVASHPINPSSTATTTATVTTTTNSGSLRSPTATPTQSQLPTPLSLAPLSSSQGAAPHRQAPPSADHAIGPLVQSSEPVLPSAMAASPLARVRLSEIALYDGAPAVPYLRAVEALSGSLMRHNAAVIELGSDDAAVMRCGLEAARLYFRSRAQQSGGKGGRGVYMYRAGRYEISFSVQNSI